MVFEEGPLEEVPEIAADRAAWPIVRWEMKPGDAVALPLTCLRSTPRLVRRRGGALFHCA